MLSLLWNELLYRPLYNLLIFFTYLIPGHDLGVSIILLTVLIRFILYIPSRNSLKSQAAMQELQPKIQSINEKHKENPQKKAEETMKLYKEHGVNPFGSCLPLLVQLPILIALFNVFRDGLNTSGNVHLYPFLLSFDFSLINVVFLGFIDLINITPTSRYLMPLIVGSLQFYQMKTLNTQQDKNRVPVKPGQFDPQASMKMMTYILPVMVAFFATSYAAGLSLYWATSTVFSIFQQNLMFKAREAMGNKESKKNVDEVMVDLGKIKNKIKKRNKK